LQAAVFLAVKTECNVEASLIINPQILLRGFVLFNELCVICLTCDIKYIGTQSKTQIQTKQAST